MDNFVDYVYQNNQKPIIAVAIHNGHKVHTAYLRHMAISENKRLEEEDPYTGFWAKKFSAYVVVNYTRFEVDFNRTRDRAVYKKPEDAWGLKVWQNELPEKLVSRSLNYYDSFYHEMFDILTEMKKKFNQFIVLDLHSYNLRNGKPENNPEIEVGTKTMLKPEKWQPLTNVLIKHLRSYKFKNRYLDIKKNVKYPGGDFPRWVHRTFPKSACVFSLEFQKFFMDKNNRIADMKQVNLIAEMLKSIESPLLELL